MKVTYSNFRPFAQIATFPLDTVPRRFAKVTETVERGWWRWKTRTVREVLVYKDSPASRFWRYLENGQYAPGDAIECLAAAYDALQSLPKEPANAQNSVA